MVHTWFWGCYLGASKPVQIHTFDTKGDLIPEVFYDSFQLSDSRHSGVAQGYIDFLVAATAAAIEQHWT